jgi:hypothetical protein
MSGTVKLTEMQSCLRTTDLPLKSFFDLSFRNHSHFDEGLTQPFHGANKFERVAFVPPPPQPSR